MPGGGRTRPCRNLQGLSGQPGTGSEGITAGKVGTPPAPPAGGSRAAPVVGVVPVTALQRPCALRPAICWTRQAGQPSRPEERTMSGSMRRTDWAGRGGSVGSSLLFSLLLSLPFLLGAGYRLWLI